MDIRQTRIDLLHPKMIGPASTLAEYIGFAYEADMLQFRYEVFETYRSLDRQDRLFTKGTSKARAGQSAHNYGLAIDFAAFLSQAEAVALDVKMGWYWPDASHEDWNVIGRLAEEVGLVQPISWDRPHIEFPRWKLERKAW